MNRRSFLRNTSSLAALAALHQTGFAQWTAGPRRRVALIGTGWYGKSDLFRLMQVASVDVVGLCDVDRQQLEGAQALVQSRLRQTATIPGYKDYRALLKEQRPDIVLIGTPDHWHALQAIDAVKSGAHVYLQKPISVDVIEGEAVVAAARKHGRIIQVGTQRRSTPHLIEAKKRFIDSGAIGKVHHAEMFCYYHMRRNATPAVQPVPEYFDYDMWTGPAPLRAFDGMPHRGWWRAFMEYGNGIMGDMCIHMYDTVRWMLGLGWPSQISSSGGIYGSDPGRSNIADTQTAIFQHPGITCVWQHRTWGTSADPDYPWGFKIYGDKGTLCGSTMRYDFIPVGKGERVRGDVVYEREQFPEDLTEKDIELHAAPATRQHMKDLLDAIEGKRKPVADIGEGHISTASCIMANLSMQLGRPLSYDPQKMVVPGDKEATSLLRRKYRQGWVHPEP
jgi:predicted dehydrogenase